MKIRVIVLRHHFDATEAAKFDGFVPSRDNHTYLHEGTVYRDYTMDHNDPAQRRVLGEQVRNAFEGGQCAITYPVVE